MRIKNMVEKCKKTKYQVIKIQILNMLKLVGHPCSISLWLLQGCNQGGVPNGASPPPPASYTQTCTSKDSTSTTLN